MRLGSTRAESRTAMGLQPHTFRKFRSDAFDTDAYYQSSFQVYFDSAERVEYIELSRGQSSFGARYKGVDVFASRTDDVIALITRDAVVDESNPEFPYSYVFPSLELALWRSSLPDAPDDVSGHYFDTIGIGRSGYFSSRSSQ